MLALKHVIIIHSDKQFSPFYSIRWSCRLWDSIYCINVLFTREPEKECKKSRYIFGFLLFSQHVCFHHHPAHLVASALLITSVRRLRISAPTMTGREEEISEVYAILINEYSQNKHNAVFLSIAHNINCTTCYLRWYMTTKGICLLNMVKHGWNQPSLDQSIHPVLRSLV
jgi:hypothetical protein